MTFWIIIAATALAVAATLALALLRRRESATPAAAYDIQVYRDQLKEVDRELARGVIEPENADQARAEISRRLLAADTKLHAVRTGRLQSHGVSVAMAVVVVVAILAGSLALYNNLGSPGYGDLSQKRRITLAENARMTRPSQQEVEAELPARPRLDNLSPEYRNLVVRLRETVATRPNDLQGHMLLARNEAALGNMTAAYGAQKQVLRLKGDKAVAQDWADYADMMIQAAGGYVSPKAEEALTAAMKRDQKNPTARYYWGLMLAQTGRPDLAFQVWNELLRDGAPDAPWTLAVRAQIEDMARHAGVNFTLPPEATAPGPSAEDIEAAAEMSDADRNAMIRSMVDTLSQRLASQGGTPQEWARLIGALSVLGDHDQARRIFANAGDVFAERPDAMQIIDDAARQSGLIE
ncbi:c-type cytochrome biogenesis protein CcmI [Pontibaca salina]|uniref:C-type cytochrome biogenesis protein CcmI n=1 Tax=Pontibaca salina TaxID=2795731 RepID=A0A934HQR6_9RHOB|nr:c-type cytochrome biogenesis protein CcmI [Pontibaca salina]MBI6629196.1 c-type cytochrome biogenesis protein CcmI [Pontibaca salina]